MEKLREISKTEIVLAFAATCVEALARTLCVSYYEAFRMLKDADLFNTQIFPFYDVLHTESREVVVQRLIDAIPKFSSRDLLVMKSSQDKSKDPIIQEIVMSNLIGMVTTELSRRLDISPQRAFDMFYESDTCRSIHDKSTGLYLYGPLYIADEFVRENQQSGV